MTRFLLVLVFCTYFLPLAAQRQCVSGTYAETIKSKFPHEQQARVQSESTDDANYNTPDTATITIPVVIHVVYFSNEQNISLQQIQSQLDALNKDFNGQTTDLQKIPAYFKPLAAGAGVRFELAKKDPQGFSTSGINRIKTTKRYFKDDDQVKFTTSSGADAWDASKYLNIWVCDLDLNLMGYASFPGGPANRDGVVIDYKVFGTAPYVSGAYNKGRTLVHELGHWLGLKHLWGDYWCGDDGIADTPPQQKGSRGCPSGEIFSCGTTSHGDMYMNFMDFTDDACMYTFTAGQRAAMRSNFKPGGYMYALTQSDAARSEGIAKAPLPETTTEPQATPSIRLFPNPVQGKLTLDLKSEVPAYTTLQVFNHMGQQIFQQQISQTVTTISTSQFKPGIYFVQLKGNAGEWREKFVKM